MPVGVSRSRQITGQVPRERHGPHSRRVRTSPFRFSVIIHDRGASLEQLSLLRGFWLTENIDVQIFGLRLGYRRIGVCFALAYGAVR